MRRKLLSMLILTALLVTMVSPAWAQEPPTTGDSASPNIFLPLISSDLGAEQLNAPLEPTAPAPPSAAEPEPEDQTSAGIVQAASPPSSPTDLTRVPHYFGPYPNWANSPFALPDVTVQIIGNGSGATAVASVGANGAVTEIAITDPGVGYTSANVTLASVSGAGATATATVVTSGIVTSIRLDTTGAGYTSPLVSFAGGGGSGTLVQVGNQLIARTYATDYATNPGVLGPVFVVVQAAMPTSGAVQSIQYFNQATAGSSPTPSAGNLFHAYVLRATGLPNEYTVVWDSGELTVPAAVDPVGDIVTIPVPNVSVTTEDRIAFYGEGIPVDSTAGTDILSYPAPAAPLQNSTITVGAGGFPMYPQNRTYSFAASVLDTSAVAALTGATATAFGGVDVVTLGLPGYGYTNPTVDFDLPDDPNGVIAKAHAEFDAATGAITAIVVDQSGSGYTQAPNVVIRDGTLYDPIMGGTGATATATLALQSITVDAYGSGYTAAPVVNIADATGTGFGASATASVSAGGVTAITVNTPGAGYITAGGIKKFTDPLPTLCAPPNCPSYATNPTAKYIPVGVPEAKTYNGIAADEYVIGLVQYRTLFSSSLPPTLVRGYIQLETPANAAISQHFPVTNELLDGTQVPVMKGDGTPWFAVTPPQWLGPTILATKDKPVRIVFYNLLPNGAAGDLFLPTDSTMMGSGEGSMSMNMPVDQGSVMDGVRNPTCTQEPKPAECFKDNRATLHLHGGITPWISDGTPHQWITPANENTAYPQGVSVGNVPDMDVCTTANDGCQTFYYTNQQSARLMFYHDHAWGITRLNVYAGEAAGYLISDSTEQALLASGTIPTEQIPLLVQDRTFVPQDAQLIDGDPANGVYGQDPSWDKSRWGGYGSFWYHHVYMPAQNPGDPGGMSAYGRWMYGPWFWPPAADTVYGPIANPYYNMDPATDFTTPLAVPCNLDDPATWQYQTDPFCEPQQIPGTPNVSAGMEQFNDTPIVNGVAYPTLTLEPKAYRMRILSVANDRFFNFQWYVGDPATANAQTGATEVALNPAELAAAQTDPNIAPTPIQGAATAGPDWIQIGTEGGFLPTPVVVDGQQPTTWVTDPTRFDVGNVDKHSLLLAPAERADVIVDFSRFAGKTLILYNDAPAAFPARVPSYDYYTGAPDMSPNGASVVLPGYGPNTRTIMQVKIAATTPAAAFNLTKLQAAFRHTAAGSGVFESSQHPIIVGQAAYNMAYGVNFAASSNCNASGSTLQRCDGLVRVSDTETFGFNTLRAQNTKQSMPLQPKAIHDEMNATTFDEFGRMQANLGIEAQPPTPGLQNVTLYPYTNPQTELIDATNLPRMDVTYDANGLPVSDVKISPISNMADGSQIWRITHNGVDTHPIHFHLYDVQVLNRVTWDNIILATEPNELGWKDTVRVSPLEDTIVALRPIIPELPWELPNSIRSLSPMDPLGSMMGFNNVDPAGNPTNPIMNQLVNFGWEYVYHCHILSHEEMDMMRPVSVAMPPVAPSGLAYSLSGNGNNQSLTLTWNDNSIAETSFVVQRTTDGATWTNLGVSVSPLDQPNTRGPRTYTDATYQRNATYQYRVVALNTVGYGAEFPSMTVQSVSAPLVVGNPPAAPTNLSATYQNGPQIGLTWRDNANNETGFIVERAANGGAFAQIATAPARNNTGNVTFVDATVAAGNSYVYRVAAVNATAQSAYATSATVVAPAAPAVPSTFTAANGPNSGRNSRRVVLTWSANTANVTGFTIQRATNANFTNGLNSVNVAANNTTITQNGLNRNTQYYFRIRANNGALSSAWLNATPLPIRTNP
ncbi:MAG: fibronectin type III domain-containing protein, partial [Caldilinea sp.]